jgi:hypothetical protein
MEHEDDEAYDYKNEKSKTMPNPNRNKLKGDLLVPQSHLHLYRGLALHSIPF